MFANGDCVKSTGSFVRLWLHETSRIYGDKLIDKKDQETFTKTIIEQIKKTFSVSNFCKTIITSLFNIIDYLHFNENKNKTITFSCRI